MSVSIHFIAFHSEAEVLTRMGPGDRTVEVFVDNGQSADCSLKLTPELALELHRKLANTLIGLKGNIL